MEPISSHAHAQRRAAASALLVILGLVALGWGNSVRAPLLLDDHSSILTNPSIRDLASLDWLTPPASRGETVGGRPVLNFTLAVNHAVSGFDVRIYHVTNCVFHVFAALILYGLVWRTMSLVRRASAGGDAVHGFALVVAAIWAVHPLQTQSVTYVIQRAEVLMSLCYLLTLYGFVRSVGSPQPLRWKTLAVVACALGMGTKENMVSAPLLVLLLDRAFVAGSFRAAISTRRAFYAALASTWIVLAVLVVGTGGNRGGSAGFDVGVSAVSYWLTQFVALCRYGMLSVWPHPLVFEYGDFSVPGFVSVAPQAIVVGAALAATVYAVVRKPALGFVAALPFAILAPTSIVPGTLQMIVEHRMYLPLASVVIVLCLGARIVLPRQWLRSAAVLLIIALVGLTVARNRTYATELSLWHDTAAKAPSNPRAHNNLGLAFREAGRPAEAAAAFRRAIELQPNHAFAHANLGVLCVQEHRWQDAAKHLAAALEADPHLVSARVNLGVALTQLGRPAEATAQYEAALRDEPGAADARTNLAALWLELGRGADAEAMLREVLATDSSVAEAQYHLGRAVEKTGRRREAEQAYQRAAQLKPGFSEPLVALGNLAAAEGQLDRAAEHYRGALRVAPANADAHYGIGNVHAKRQDFHGAMAAYVEALRIDPDHVMARNNLANCQLATGAFREAVQNYERVLALRQDNRAVRQNLEVARQMLREQRTAP